MSIILGLDPFNLLYEQIFCKLQVLSGHTLFFTSALNHAGGRSVTVAGENSNEYMYQLFVYIVSTEVDYPPEVATRVK
jgi:hypothetical protein